MESRTQATDLEGVFQNLGEGRNADFRDRQQRLWQYEQDGISVELNY